MLNIDSSFDSMCLRHQEMRSNEVISALIPKECVTNKIGETYLKFIRQYLLFERTNKV